MAFRDIWQCQENICLHFLTAPSFDKSTEAHIKGQDFTFKYIKGFIYRKEICSILAFLHSKFHTAAKMTFQKPFWDVQRTFSKVLCWVTSSSRTFEWPGREQVVTGCVRDNGDRWGLQGLGTSCSATQSRRLCSRKKRASKVGRCYYFLKGAGPSFFINVKYPKY